MLQIYLRRIALSNPSVYDNRSRDGLSSIRDLARKCCGVASWSAPIIELKYRNNEAILALLQAVLALCAALPAADAAMMPTGDNADVSLDPTTAGGVDVSAPPPPAPPES